MNDLARGAALFLITGLAAGCSSGVSRFSADDFVTNSVTTNNQQQVIRRVAAPTAPAVNDYVAAPSSGGVTRSSLPPVGGAPAAAAVANAPAAAPKIVRAPAPDPIQTSSAATAKIDPMSRVVERVAQPAPAKPKAAATEVAGWSAAGGSQVTAKEGETIFNLSRRYGVPANVLMKVNGLDDSGKLQVGQKVIIPTYIYSDRAPVSAPDNNPKVAAAKSTRGERTAEDDARLKEAAARLENAPQPKSAPVSKAGVYVVESGDSILGIARDHGVSASELRSANGLTTDAIRIGQKLTIPGTGAKVAAKKPAAEKSTAEKPKTTADASASKPKPAPVETAKPKVATTEPVKPKATPAAYTPPKASAVAAVEAESDDVAPGSSGIGKMRWPAKGRVISSYGKGAGKSRDGIDISVPEGTAVKSAENGVVIYAGNGLKEFGNTVLVRHDNGLVTVYGNNGSLNVKRGQTVKRGEQIATSGMTGDADQPKLHFEVRKNSAPVDPSTYLD
jgi:murein DD-endopeptidase MepM/ murein hydrolase activator NlpD